ncbi:2Fe-2S iron-sulfur cluster-binding protein [Arenibaculum sp.]|jgi:2Fe-2S ferredoxin|uniref:2Fe-2S iron-sulfur cluster-binding protein n=1 Tax=Arenibaculum sp. TaxID=2865862 RepID=UPI002E1334D2|nr:2Fe-2S iron-sulfur cluster-binding protein [Arenibaculum sp.]
MKIHVTDYAGATHEIHAEADWPLMECIKAAGLPLPAECGGCCLCSTCHVYVAPEWAARLPSRSADEETTLADAPDVLDASRLSCQIRITPDLDGLAVTLAPTLA